MINVFKVLLVIFGASLNVALADVVIVGGNPNLQWCAGFKGAGAGATREIAEWTARNEQSWTCQVDLSPTLEVCTKRGFFAVVRAALQENLNQPNRAYATGAVCGKLTRAEAIKDALRECNKQGPCNSKYLHFVYSAYDDHTVVLEPTVTGRLNATRPSMGMLCRGYSFEKPNSGWSEKLGEFQTMDLMSPECTE